MSAAPSRRLAAVVAGVCFAVIPATAIAQDEGATPTTIDVETETSEVTITTTDVEAVNPDVADDDDDDSDKTGLWGLLGLLGLLGLAGLAGRKRTDGYAASTTVTGDTTPRGSTTKNP